MQSAELVLPAAPFDETLGFFTSRLGFRVETIYPADRPSTAVVVGHGLRLRLDRQGSGDGGALVLACRDADAVAGGFRRLTAPNGTQIELVDADPPVVVPPLVATLSVVHAGPQAVWGTGRAGMQYRDLIPDRQGGRFIASHIRIPEGGPVPDYAHFHKVRFQAIFCHRGWVKVVYEDQGEPFVMQAGDCVLQPPQIRHRVLEASSGLEVVEIGCPAEHETRGDLSITLPTGISAPERRFGGQRFSRHHAVDASWQDVSPTRQERCTGISAATEGLAGVRVVRLAPSSAPAWMHHEGEFLFWFVRAGAAALEVEGEAPIQLGLDDAVTVPPHRRFRLMPGPGLELLEVTLPGALPLFA
ncbi:MAG: cupin [Alphaproteobacteria bacterium]|nr:MAG: cupin [Alphaproteobacteria bacterium]